MNIYINNEEVLCASKMTIKEQLKNTSSVILNNVYPKAWEQDKDYVSRFYMPKDYSHCSIKNDSETETEVDFTNNVYIENNRAVDGSMKLTYSERSNITYIRVIPGKTYTITYNNKYGSSIGVFQSNSIEIGAQLYGSGNVQNGEGTRTITPMRKYIISYSKLGRDAVTFTQVKTSMANNLVFSGMVKNSGNIELNPRYPHYSTLQILDYKAFLSEGDTLNYVLESQTTKSAIKNIIKDLDGFYVGELNIPDETIAAYNCNEKTAYDVFEYLTEITGSIWYTKAISETTIMINFSTTDALVQRPNIEYTKQYFEENNIQDIKYSYSSNDYRNKQAIVNEDATANISQTEYLTYNGEYMNTTYPIGKMSSITSGSKSYTFASTEAESNGVYANFYFTINDKKIEPNITIATGSVFKVTYYPKVITRQVAYNESEIKRINENTKRNGIIARYEKRTDTNNEKSLAQIAQSYLDYKGTPEITIQVLTYEKDIFNIGDRVFFNGPLESLKTNYLVTEKEIEMITAGSEQTIFYKYKLSSSFNDESAINYFDNQRRKLEGNIEEGQYISRYIDLPSSVNIIFYGVEFQDIPAPNDALDGVLDIELVGENDNKLESVLEFVL